MCEPGEVLTQSRQAGEARRGGGLGIVKYAVGQSVSGTDALDLLASLLCASFLFGSVGKKDTAPCWEFFCGEFEHRIGGRIARSIRFLSGSAGNGPNA